ncbi:MAG TPA: SGNH/GDSL hydrolase family protein [Terracidiphilus sp.]|nr:SGNH/GDSL hydrolase family protein [Terracidiphilus sp.]
MHSPILPAAVAVATLLLCMPAGAAAQTPAGAAAQTPAVQSPTAQAAATTAPNAAAQSWHPQNAYWKSHDEQLLNDFPWLGRFHDANEQLGPPKAGEDRVVFMGDSITEGWELAKSFPGKPYVNRGISGQTSPQMLVRFRQDVIHLDPKAVVILAGTNDIAGNTGPETLEQMEDNLASMADLAEANHIKVVLCSVTPSVDFPWHRGQQPAPKIEALNAWMQHYSAEKGYVYVDYHSVLADADGGMKPGLSKDGVHPTAAGYALMAPLAEAGIEKALAQ